MSSRTVDESGTFGSTPSVRPSESTIMAESPLTEHPTGAESRVIGLIGLGLMGGAMGKRLMHGRYFVHGFDLRAECNEALRRSGGTVEPDLVSLVARCPRIVLSLPDSE